ncbi:signal peptidase I [Hydrogenophaga aquatica]
MSALTALVLGAFAAYGGAWYLGMIEGNFALLLLLAVVVTGVYWLAERFYFLPQRQRAADALVAEHARRQAELDRMGVKGDNVDIQASRERLLMQPWWLDWTAGLFPVILVVFVLRSFLFEPFKIPSGSMIPTLRVGDLILVNKFHYGVRLPVANTKIISNNEPQRGDVMVFRYPPQPSLDYIKRVVGVPGDEVAYLNKQLFVNGQPVEKVARPEFYDSDSMRYSRQFGEVLNGKHYNTLNDDDRPAFIPGASDFPGKEHCRYTVEGVACKVPEGHYFMMGDNRDNSLDSRYWGFVPEANIVGKAFFVWMNFGDFKRIGAFE